MLSQKMTVMVKDSSVEIHGVDLGGVSTLVAWARRDGFVTIKIPGGMYWSGRGQQAYSPARFATYKVLTWIEAGDRFTFEVEKVIEHDLRATPLRLKAV